MPIETATLWAGLLESDGIKRLAWSLALAGVLMLARRVVLWGVTRRSEDPQSRYWWRKGSYYVAVLLLMMGLGGIWLGILRDVATYLGLLSAGLAVALQSLVLNLAGWVYVLWRRPFDVGDRIGIDGVVGDVIDLRPFQFSLMEVGSGTTGEQSTGRIVHVPNGKVFGESVTNHTGVFPFIWIELPVLVTFESDWRKAKAILERLAEIHSADPESVRRDLIRANERYLLRYSVLTSVVYTSVLDSGVVLTARVLGKPRERRGLEQRLWEAILDAFAAENDIDFAYPTVRYYDNVSEGKVGKPPSGSTRL